MDVKKDYYKALGLRPSATLPDIKTAYRVLARRLHPDANAAPDAAERFRQVQEAYEILSDPTQKGAYDQWREREGLAEPPALVMRRTISHHTLPRIDEEQVLYVLLDISPSPKLEIKRMPFNLCLVIDRSTSMQGVRLQRVKDATNFIIDFLDESDTFSLVTFSDRAEVVIPAQANIDKTFAKSRVSTIQSAGGTEILQGLLLGLNEIDRWRSPDVVNHLILLTDGQTYGGESECIQEAEAASHRKITITTMGIGQDWNDKLLDQIASRSGGTSTYIDSASRVTSFFRQCLHTLTTIIARDLHLTVRLSEDARLQQAFRVSPYMEQLSVEDAAISLGQLGAEQPASLMLEILVNASKPGRMRVAQLEVTAEVPSVAQVSQLTKKEVEIDVVDDLQLTEPPPPSIVSTLGKLAIFKMQEKTMRDLEAGELDKASQRLETMATRLLNIGENELAKAALLEAGRLARTGHLSPEGRKRIRYGTRSLSVLPKEVSGDQM
jgi:Ca-activated chloride channel family protein